MISNIAWDNIHWLKETFFDRMDQNGGSYIAVDSFRPYMKRSWLKQLEPEVARRQLFAYIESWAVGIKTTPLTSNFKMDHWTEGIQVARGGQDYSEHLWFLLRTHYNLYCLAPIVKQSRSLPSVPMLIATSRSRTRESLTR